MEIALNPANKELFTTPADIYYSVGGRWSGKTYDSIQIILHRLLCVPGSRACFMRKHYANIKETLYSDTKDICNSLGIEGRALKSPLEVQLPNGSTIIYRGLDEVDKAKGMSSIDIVLMDELNEFTQLDFETIRQSIRGTKQPTSIYLCHNPVPRIPGTQHWFEALFRVDKLPGVPMIYYSEALGATVASMKSTYRQNIACPDHVKKSLEGYKETNPDLYKLWALGEYAEIHGAVFNNWDIVDAPPEGLDDPGYGLDFGFSADPAACTRIWMNSTDIWIQGVVYSTSLTNKELYDILISRGVGEYDEVTADSAEPKSIQDLYNYGMKNVSGVKKKPNYKVEVVQIMQGYNLHLVDGDTDLQREFQTYSWQRDKEDRQIPKLQDGNDHYIDSVIMYCHEHLGEQSSVVY